MMKEDLLHSVKWQEFFFPAKVKTGSGINPTFYLTDNRDPFGDKAHYCRAEINPLAYTDVPETAGLARSINP